MSLSKEEMEELKQLFNLNLYEAKLWTALITKGTATAGELAEYSRVPRSRAYDVLESLQKKGFISSKISKPIKYVAMHPKDIVEKIKQDVHQETGKKLENIEKIKEKEVYKELNELYSRTTDNENITTTAIKGRYNIYTRMNKILNQAKEEVIISTNEDGLIRKSYELEDTFKKLKEKGIKIRFIVNKADDKIKTKINEYGLLSENSDLDMRMTIVDNSKVLLITTKGKEVPHHQELGILIESPYMAQGFKNILNRI